jgi:hypothetical protein
MADDPNTAPVAGDEPDISDVQDSDNPDDVIEVAAASDDMPDETPKTNKAVELDDAAAQFEKEAEAATGDRKDALLVAARQNRAEAERLIQETDAALAEWNRSQEQKNITQWVDYANDAQAYDAALDAGRKMKDKETVAFWLNFWAHNDLANPRRQQIMHGLFDAYYNTPGSHQPVAPPQHPPHKERQKPAQRETAAPRAAVAAVSPQMLDFYVKTRRYAQGLSWQALNNNVYQYGNAVAVTHPTLVPRLQFRAYVNELLARYRHARPS